MSSIQLLSLGSKKSGNRFLGLLLKIGLLIQIVSLYSGAVYAVIATNSSMFLAGKKFTNIRPIANRVGSEGTIYLVENSNGQVFAMKVYIHEAVYDHAKEREYLVDRVVKQNPEHGLKWILSGKTIINGEPYFVEVYPYVKHMLHDIMQTNQLTLSPQSSVAANLLKLDKLVDLSLDFLRILNTLARAEVNHFDIKPANIGILLDAQQNLKPFLIDWGTAEPLKDFESLTTPNNIAGTSRFKSPERIQKSREPLTHWSEYYSIGMTLYEVLTDRMIMEYSLDTGFIELFKNSKELNRIHNSMFIDIEEQEELILAQVPAKKMVDAALKFEFLSTLVYSALKMTAKERIATLKKSPFSVLLAKTSDAEASLSHTRFNIPDELNGTNFTDFILLDKACGDSLTQNSSSGLQHSQLIVF